MQRSENKYSDLYNNAPDMFISVDVKTAKIEECNQTLANETGFRKEEIIGRSIFSMFAPDCVDYAKKHMFQQFIKNGIIEGEELKVCRKDGSEINVLLKATAVRDQNGKIIQSRSVWRDISERKKAEDKIKASLKEKETLLQEIHHRVKNNLAVVSSLLGLQSNNLDDDKLKSALMESRSRVNSMSFIHEALYQSESLSQVDMKTYLSKLMKDIARNYQLSANVHIEVDIKNVAINAKQASPIGLIVNEMASNSFKYAFHGQKKGKIKVRLNETDGHYELVYSDNGIGIKENVNLENPPNMGFQLIKILSEGQLKGSIKINRDQGTCFTIHFEREDKLTDN